MLLVLFVLLVFCYYKLEDLNYRDALLYAINRGEAGAKSFRSGLRGLTETAVKRDKSRSAVVAFLRASVVEKCQNSYTKVPAVAILGSWILGKRNGHCQDPQRSAVLSQHQHIVSTRATGTLLIVVPK